MKLYIIRHAESESNASDIYHGFEAKLTPKGVNQADLVARRLGSLRIDRLISSTMPRAIHTAEVIAGHLKVPFEQNELFVERRKPSIMKCRSLNDPEIIQIEKEIEAHLNEPEWHYSDEENFAELKERALAALAYIRTLPEEHVAVVSHGIFLRVLLGCVIHGEQFTAAQYWEFLWHLKTDNTGITTFAYESSAITQDHAERWRLTTWNDHAHLPENSVESVLDTEVSPVSQSRMTGVQTTAIKLWLVILLAALAVTISMLWIVFDHRQPPTSSFEFNGAVRVSTTTENGTIRIYAATTTNPISIDQPAALNLDEIQLQ
ncbi:MAG: histidine phosphatase family protein [Candidatus Buchananbacteria bacterium]|nr:histidine phosphatase family protein [Candidatus Buchananbacteria bacterium]